MNLTQQMEALIDQHGVRNLLLELAFIAAEKADHVRANWQDETTARTWEHASRICDAAQLKVDV